MPAPGYWHTSAFSRFMIRCPNTAACSLEPPMPEAEEEAQPGDETTGTSSSTTTTATSSRPVIRIDSVAESLLMLSADDPRTTQLTMCQAWTFAGGNTDPNATAYAPCVLSDPAGDTWRANELLRSIQAAAAAAVAAAAGQRSQGTRAL